jgi:hypothetical protein
MQYCKLSIGVVTAFLVCYTLSPYMGVPAWVISSAYLLSPFLVVWMVICILKKGQPSGRTFDEGYFYDDEQAPQSVEKDYRNAA